MATQRFSLSPMFPRDLQSTTAKVKVHRFDRIASETTAWNFLRKDPELWFPEGDCLVYLYGRGQSFRGPSFRIPYAGIIASGCSTLPNQCRIYQGPDHEVSTNFNYQDAGFFGNPSRVSMYELYLPAPESSTGDQAFEYHITTRNMFAFMFDKPLVGSDLGIAMINLTQRIGIIEGRSSDNEQALIQYLDGQGYSICSNNPAQSLAMVYIAEQYQNPSLWADAFTHCVGMAGVLTSCPEVESISRVTRILINRSKVEMDLQLGSANQLLNTFEVASGGTSLLNLEPLRLFLVAYHETRYGSWPLPSATQYRDFFDKTIYTEMLLGFSSVYEYLADTQFNEYYPANLDNENHSILEAIKSFDTKHHYTPLPYKLPLLPQNTTISRKNSTTSQVNKLKSFVGSSRRRNSKDSSKDIQTFLETTLASASDPNSTPLLEAYRKFEKDTIYNEISTASFMDARRSHWVLIYKFLQTLIYITSSPSEVSIDGEVSYPLCCKVAELPTQPTAAQRTRLSRPTSLIIPSRSSSVKFQKSYAASCGVRETSRRNSFAIQALGSADLSIHPLRLSSSAQHRISHSLPLFTQHKTVPRLSNYTEIIIDGYGNGLHTFPNTPSIYSRSLSSVSSDCDSPTSRSGSNSARTSLSSIYSASVYSRDEDER